LEGGSISAEEMWRWSLHEISFHDLSIVLAFIYVLMYVCHVSLFSNTEKNIA
jgi:hypothetical protein